MSWNKYNESDKENALLEILNKSFTISAVSTNTHALAIINFLITFFG